MTRSPCATLGLALVVAALPAVADAQAREWTTSGFDAQRTGWIRSDARLDEDSVRKASSSSSGSRRSTTSRGSCTR